jgi:glycosyltransferase involved in cell wall biosynthesis
MAVKVLDRVIKVYPSASLCMVGPNKDGSREKVEALAAKMGLSEHLKITGKLSKEEWISLSNDYDIFINTTNFDNLPVSIIEAMCLGFPIVSTNAGGLPYLIENNEDGLLVNLDDDKSMAENIIKLLQDNEFASAMSAKAIEKGKSFEWEEIAPAWYKLIESSGVKKTI